jgi:hypothetical protein
LIFAAVTFLSSLTLGVLLAICVPFLGMVWGAAAGILTVTWSKSVAGELSAMTRAGARAGLLAGVGGVLGLVLGMWIQYTQLGGQEAGVFFAEELSREFDLPLTTGAAFEAQQWIGFYLVSFCLGLLTLALLAGAGALAARLWAGRAATPEA